MKSQFTVRNAAGTVVEDCKREKPSMRTLARKYGKRCRREGLAVYRTDFDAHGVPTGTVLIGNLHREEEHHGT